MYKKKLITIWGKIKRVLVILFCTAMILEQTPLQDVSASEIVTDTIEDTVVETDDIDIEEIDVIDNEKKEVCESCAGVDGAHEDDCEAMLALLEQMQGYDGEDTTDSTDTENPEETESTSKITLTCSCTAGITNGGHTELCQLYHVPHDGCTETAIPITMDTDLSSLVNGEYYLAENIVLNDTWTISNNVDIHLCLNDKVIHMAEDVSARVIMIESDSSLELYDCGVGVKCFTDADVDGCWEYSADTSFDENEHIDSVTGGVITGGSVSENADDVRGGGIFVRGKFTMHQGNIVGNCAVKASNNINGVGGGIYGYNGEITIEGGTIAGNLSRYGGGLGIAYQSGQCILSGGEIRNNTAIYGGGGVYICSDAVGLTLNGQSSIIDSIYLEANNKITINSLQTETPISIVSAVTPGETEDTWVQFTNTSDTNYAAYFESENENYYIVNKGKALYLMKKPAEAHTHEADTELGLSEMTFEPWLDLDTLPNTFGNWYLPGDVELSATWSVPTSEVSLCLNDKVVKMNENVKQRVIDLPKTATLNLFDCNQTPKYFTVDDSGLWKYIGRIKLDDSNESAEGGIITGGDISNINNWGSSFGGCILALGNFNMYAGNIIGNKAYNGGALSSHDFGTGKKVMYGGTIAGNVAKDSGGAIYLYVSDFNMENGVIKNNTAKNGGGCVILQNASHFNLTNGVISNNEAAYGGAVYVANGSAAVSFAGGIVTNNISTAKNGGAFYGSGTIKVGGNVQIYENYYRGEEFIENNIYLSNNQKIVVSSELMSDAKIGVTTQTLPTIEDLTEDGLVNPTVNYVPISTGNDKDYSKYFFSDNENYFVNAVKQSTYSVQLVTHAIDITADFEATGTGPFEYGQKLTASIVPSTLTEHEAQVTQSIWERSKDNGLTWETITIISGAVYETSLDDIGHSIRVSVIMEGTVYNGTFYSEPITVYAPVISAAVPITIAGTVDAAGEFTFSKVTYENIDNPGVEAETEDTEADAPTARITNYSTVPIGLSSIGWHWDTTSTKNASTLFHDYTKVTSNVWIGSKEDNAVATASFIGNAPSAKTFTGENNFVIGKKDADNSSLNLYWDMELGEGNYITYQEGKVSIAKAIYTLELR